MFSRIRRRFTYANVAMTLALVFAMSGGAFAAGKYLITSPKQISPKVLKALKGANGKPGTAGPAGPAGATGPAGPAGAAGAKGETGAPGAPGEPGKPGEAGKNGTTGFTEKLPSGRSEQGQWALSDNVAEHEHRYAPLSYPIPLATEPTPHYIGLEEGAGEPKEAPAIKNQECGGTAAEPSAAPGNLCVFAKRLTANLIPFAIFSTGIFDAAKGAAGAGKAGAYLDLFAIEAGEGSGVGTWVVTAE